MTQLRHTEMTCISLISCQQNLEQQDSWNMYIWNYFKAEYGQIYGHILLNESFIELKRVKWIPSPRSITAKTLRTKKTAQKQNPQAVNIPRRITYIFTHQFFLSQITDKTILVSCRTKESINTQL